jgi:hypothetical protein
MKVKYEYTEQEYRQMLITARRINHDLAVIEQNKENQECVNEQLDNIKFFTDKLLQLLQGEIK